MEKLANGETDNLIEDVNKTCLEYCVAIKLPLVHDDGSINRDGLESFDNVLLDLADVCDTEAHTRKITCDEELAWVDSARKGFKRLAKDNPMCDGLNKTRLFATEAEDMQREIYFEMLERRRGS